MSSGTSAPRFPDPTTASSRISEPAPTPAPHTTTTGSATATGAQQQRPSSQQSHSQFSPQQHLHLQTPPNTYFPGPPVIAAPYPDQQLQRPEHVLNPYAPPQSHFVSQPPPATGTSATGPAVYSPYFPRPEHTVPDAQPGYSSLQHSPQQHLFHQTSQPPFTQSYSSYHPSPLPPTASSTFYAQSAPSSHAAPAAPAYPPGIGQHQFSSSPPRPSAIGPTMPPKRAAAQAAAAPPIEPSPVKTKFPTARIKRIMQADEEVGKVAQQTPIAVGKALEMFMIQMVNKCADEAREKNSKRVSAAMVKKVVESDDQWDFLREIVSRIEEDKSSGAAGAKRGAKAESESEEEPVEKKKRAGRKKKAAA